MLNVIMLSLMTLVFGVYVVWIYRRFGVLKSISESYYRLPGRQRYLFTLFCWGFAIPAMIVGNSIPMVLAGVAIAFVGGAAAFKDSMTHTFHYFGALFGIILSQIAIIFNLNLWPISAFAVIIALIIYLKYRKADPDSPMIWWIEIVSFSSVILALTISVSRG